MEKKTVRKATKQPGIYKNLNTGKFDVKYNYTSRNPLTGESIREQEWIYGINSYTKAVKLLSEKKGKQRKIRDTECTLQQAFEVWKEKACANNFSPVTIRNTVNEFGMIQRFWSPNMPIITITERMYMNLIDSCRKYGYSEQTIYGINGCLRKLIRLAYKNRYINENPIDFWDSPRIDTGVRRNVLSYSDFQKLDEYFAGNSFFRLGENHYPRYRFLINLLYYTGMRIGEAIALQYSDFIACKGKVSDNAVRMHVSVTKSYNSMYKLLKRPKNNKTRKIPIPTMVREMFIDLRGEHKRHGGSMDDRIFSWDHSACVIMLRTACQRAHINNYSCHDFRHTYISNLIRSGVPLSAVESVSGDTQETIFRHYSHMFEGDEVLVLNALEKLKDGLL